MSVGARGELTVSDLAGVIYSAGKLFNGLAAGLPATEDFLRSGSEAGIASRADLLLLRDFRDAAQLVLKRGSSSSSSSSVDAEFVCAVNAAISRSGALHPGRLRTADQRIGVDTELGHHEPAAVTPDDLSRIIASATSTSDVYAAALNLFVSLAKAQPFGDGNKRTALLVANAVLIGSGAGAVLTVPVDDAGMFNSALARAYVFNDPADVKHLLHSGFVRLGG